jgi:hypothetical protein
MSLPAPAARRVDGRLQMLLFNRFDFFSLLSNEKTDVLRSIFIRTFNQNW